MGRASCGVGGVPCWGWRGGPLSDPRQEAGWEDWVGVALAGRAAGADSGAPFGVRERKGRRFPATCPGTVAVTAAGGVTEALGDAVHRCAWRWN